MKNIIKSVLKFFGVLNFINNYKRVKKKKNRAMSYYNDKLELINNWKKKDTEESNFFYDITDLNISQLTHTISNIMKVEYFEVEKLIDEILYDEDLKNYINNRLHQTNYPKNLKIEFGRRIGWYVFARLLKPKLIVETGVHYGVGSCVLIKALMRNKAQDNIIGKYIGTELDPTMGKLVDGIYKDYGEIKYGDSIVTLKMINKNIDLFINDSDHSEEYEEKEYNVIKNKLSLNSIILGDNSHITNILSKFSEENKRNYLFFKEIPKDHWYPGAGIGISF